MSLAEYVNSQFDPNLSWNDLEWLRAHWDGPTVVKGIQTVDAAVIAADLGCDLIDRREGPLPVRNAAGRPLP